MAILEIRNLSKTYGSGNGSNTALGDVSLKVEQGELVSIVGPSGCGKTTLLKSIAGLIEPSGGTVEFMGRPVRGVPDDLAVVFQDYSRSLFPWMKVGANVAFPLRSLGLRRDEIERRVHESLEAVGLGDKAGKHPYELSGGMQQRVAIARGLAYRPKVLLMDEPFASVDAQTRSELEDLTRTVHREYDMTIAFVTHDIDESVYLADRVIVLRRSPGGVLAEVQIELPEERDQISTKSMPEFIRVRSQVAQYIRSAASAAPVRAAA